MNRRIEISSRNENSRSSLVPDMHITKLDEMLNQMNENIESVQGKFRVAERLLELGDTDAAKDIYRSQIVFLESALDYFMHCLGIYAMQQMYLGNWNKTEGYKDLKVPIDRVMHAITHPEDSEWIDDVIVSHHASKTYMSPKEIKEQFTLIIGKDFFDKVADEMYYDQTSRVKTDAKLKENLDVLFKRRNKIAHQADRDHKTGNLFDIGKENVESAIDTIKTFVYCTYSLLTE